MKNRNVIEYDWPSVQNRSRDYRVTIDGQAVTCFHSSCGSFVVCGLRGTAEVEISVAIPAGFPPEGQRGTEVNAVTVRPLRYGIEAILEGARCRFRVPGPCHLVCEVEGMPDLFLFADEPEGDERDPAESQVTRFAPGQVHEIGVYHARSGEHLHIPGGAVVRGSIRGVGCSGVRVTGRGIIDCGAGPQHNGWFMACCTDVSLEGLTFIEPRTWTVKTAGVSQARISGVKILASLNASDGIDICGSEDVTVEGCFVRAGDDCLAVKSVEYGIGGTGLDAADVCRDVRNIRFEGCSVLSYLGGSALEMGHEFRCQSVRDVMWRNIDILGVHDYGSAFSIRNCDGAVIENVT